MSPDPERPSVTFLAHGAERTGPPIGLAHLLRWLGREDQVAAQVILARGGPLVADYERSGAQVRVVGRGREPVEPLAAALRRVGAPALAGRATTTARRVALRGTPPPELIYLNTIAASTLDLLAALPHRNAPLLVHVHELGIGLGAVDPTALRAALARAAVVVAASEAVADHLVADHGVDAARISVAHELVDVTAVREAVAATDRARARRRLGAPPGALSVVSVGLPDWRKAPELLLQAVWRLERTRPDVRAHLSWIGGEPSSADGARLADEARRLGLADRVGHIPHTDQTAALLAGADVFVLPSREDAFPLAALEAAAAGLPIITFASGGMVELVDSSVGQVVDYPDTVALAAAIADVADDPPGWRSRGEAALARVSARHDVSVGAPRMWAAAEAVLRGRDR